AARLARRARLGPRRHPRRQSSRARRGRANDGPGARGHGPQVRRSAGVMSPRDDHEDARTVAAEPAPSPFVTRRTDTVTIKLERFEGPLDLLLHLIKRDEIDIYDIPIAHI